MTGPATIDTTRLNDLLNSPAPPRLIDVRTPGEFQSAHIAGSHNVPLEMVREHRDAIARHLQDVVLVCRSGQRATQAEATLRGAGLANVYVLKGGMVAWEGARLAVHRGVARWDLERQVRLVAGSLVLFGVLGSIGAPTMKWLAAGVGAGLVVAAISDTCTMGMLLAKLPYNRGAAWDPQAIVTQLTNPPADLDAS